MRYIDSMETTQTYSETPNFQTVWASLQELIESQKETDRITKENSKLIINAMQR
jgi:hypothetical protein